MQASRTSIVAVLIAVELALISIAIYSVSGATPVIARGISFSGMHRDSFVAQPIAPIQVGASAHVVVRDPDSRVVVNASNDGLVHVVDKTSVVGAVWGREQIAQVRVSHIADGLLIERSGSGDGGFHFLFGGSPQRRIEISVPSDASVEIQKSSGADVSDLNGAVTVRSQDGHITLANLRGAVDAASSDGYVEASAVHSPSLTIASDDGHLGLHDISVATLNAHTDDGHVTAENVTVAGSSPTAAIHTGDGSIQFRGSLAAGGRYTIGSGDGRIEVGLPDNSNLSVSAHTSDGEIHANGNFRSNDNGANGSFKFGDGSGTLEVSSQDGSITINTNGAI
ncbi:MAG: DUF4097 domain-containing protein [Candidatus Eremiobacteraeota bacterium]|nr:DUF4097 domain-containing protein [Candidatus Eremiobacteraeota bacterium]